MNALGDKALDRIQKLISLATSPNENEARNAALLAVTQIRKLGVTLSLGTAVAKGRPSGEPVEGPSAVVITSKYPGRCRACGETYSVGDRIRWTRGNGAVHVSCR